jgi:hypothetical protein
MRRHTLPFESELLSWHHNRGASAQHHKALIDRTRVTAQGRWQTLSHGTANEKTHAFGGSWLARDVRVAGWGRPMQTSCPYSYRVHSLGFRHDELAAFDPRPRGDTMSKYFSHQRVPAHERRAIPEPRLFE